MVSLFLEKKVIGGKGKSKLQVLLLAATALLSTDNQPEYPVM